MLKTSRKNSILRSISTLTIILIFTKVLGFFRSMLFAAYFGASMHTDSYFLAQEAIRNLNSILLAGITAIIIPLYSDAINDSDGNRRTEIGSSFMMLFSIVSIALCFVFVFFSDSITNIIAVGQSEEVKRQVSIYVKILSVIIPLSTLSGYVTQILNAEKKYIYPALVGGTYAIISVLSILLFSKKYGVTVLVYSLILANFVNLLILISKSRSKLFEFSNIKKEFPLWTKTLSMMFPIMLSSATFEVQALVDRTVAGSLFEGAVTSLSYANTLYTLVTVIFTSSIITVYFTELSRNIADGNKEKWRENLTKSIQILIVVLIPISLFTFVYSIEIVSAVYLRGAFTLETVNATSKALKYYGVIFVVAGVSTILTRAYHSLRLIKIPTRISMLAVGLNILLTIFLSKYLGIAGVTIATLLSEGIALVIKCILFKNEICGNYAKNIFKTFILCSFSSIISLILIGFANERLMTLQIMLRVIIIGFVYVVGYIILISVFSNGKEVKNIKLLVKNR